MTWFHLLVAGIACVSCIVAGVVLKRIARERRCRHPSCLRCGYNLIGVIGRATTCPECGKTIGHGHFRPANALMTKWRVVHWLGSAIIVIGSYGLLVVLVVWICLLITMAE